MRNPILYAAMAGPVVFLAVLLIQNASFSPRVAPVTVVREASPGVATVPNAGQSPRPWNVSGPATSSAGERAAAEHIEVSPIPADAAPTMQEASPAPAAPGSSSAQSASGRGMASAWTSRSSAGIGTPSAYARMAQRARLAEAQADQQVALLDRVVNLSADQATSAFVAYAQGSPYYDPGIPIVMDEQGVASLGYTDLSPGSSILTAGPNDGSTASLSSGTLTPEARIYAMLTEDQQVAYSQELLNRDLWWTEIVTELAADFPTSTDAASEETPQPSDHQGDNIFDILNSGQ